MSLARDHQSQVSDNEGQLGVINGQVSTVFNIASDGVLQTRGLCVSADSGLAQDLGDRVRVQMRDSIYGVLSERLHFRFLNGRTSYVLCPFSRTLGMSSFVRR